MIAILLLYTLTQTTPAALAKPVRIDGKAATRTAGALPVYPPSAAQARVGGVVAVDVTIDPKGKVTSATVVRSIPALTVAVTDAVRRWEYKMTPPTANGAAVPALLAVAFYFDPDTGRVDEVQRIPAQGPQPKRTKTVPAAYPKSAAGGSVTGKVVIEAVVNRLGKVIDMRVVSSTSRGFEAAAREAVGQWEYEPVLAGGAAVPFVVTVTVVISPK